MIDQTSQIGERVVIGENVVIEENVKIGSDVVIGHHVVIKKDTVIGDHVQIHDLTSLGRSPGGNKKMARKPPVDLPPLIIHSHSVIGCNCVIYRGSTLHEGVLVGDLASIRENVQIGKDTIIGRNAVVENKTGIGERVTIQTGSYITADMIIEDDVFIGPCFSSSNDKYMGKGNYPHQGPTIRRGAKIGNNATLLPSITIGAESIVGAGAVVTKDVAEKETVAGNPAKPLKKK
ncbi:DapH/DapD/GlmU-related protein [Jeotgalibacillus sp. ET6]|uniref:acyltransferase n=1 Tax=Jeotgalibacillus sp. ET6 TaxID=3037260 RepID=UPI0024188861|nr:acyltransferase [Jeotgalibacillus sp. ET6]MDG5473646.1 DapH/DapD/GlmU-related protein [Jeotgalibacillus sp. ET6]